MKINLFLSDKNKLNRIILIACLTTIFIIPLLLIWQGLDFTDIGYSLTCYQQIFNDPSCIAYCLPNWMQYVIGGLWMKMFNSLGLMGINLGGVIITWLTALFTYKLLNKYIAKPILLFSLAICTIYSLHYLIIIHYDSLTGLFYIITIFLIMKYIDTRKRIYIFSAGIIECMNTLVRLPNILGFLFLLAIVIVNIIEQKKLKFQIHDISAFFAGFAVTLVLSLLIMKQMNYLNIFVNGILDLFKISNTQGTCHNKNTLIHTFFNSNIASVGYTCFVLFCIIITSILLSKLSKSKNKIILTALTIVIMIIISYYYNLHIVNIIVGTSYFICTCYIVNIKKTNTNFRLINFLGLMMLIISPVGTTVGQTITIYTSWITIPIIFYFLFNIQKSMTLFLETNSLKGIRTFSFSSGGPRIFSLLFLIFLSFNIVYGTYHFTYRDSPNKMKMNSSINNKYLKYTYTTKERASAVNELLNALSKYVHKNDYLWAEGAMSTVYYATETKPYVSEPWDLSMDIPLETALKKAKDKQFSLPVIIKQNVDTGDANWPRSILKIGDHFGISDDHNRIVDNFINQYNYRLVWSSEYFKIYITDQKNY